MIHLEPMTEPDFNDYAEISIVDYAKGSPQYRELERAVAIKTVRAFFFTKILPEGFQSKGHLFFSIYHLETKIGYLHLGEFPALGSKTLHAWNFLIFEPHRGQGFGKKTMMVAEKHLKALGYQRVTLNVWGNNTVALELYKAMGFEINQIQMSRGL